MVEHSEASYAEALGEQLRNVRQQQGLSLQEVEERSDGALKASVVGAYERGERAVSVTRLRALADFYRVPIGQFLPGSASAPTSAELGPGHGLSVDLTRLSLTEVPEMPLVRRYLSAIQVRRGDYNGRVLTIRRADLEALAAVLHTSADELAGRLVEAGAARERV